MSLFELAYTLRMPVYKLVEEMPYVELLGWQRYFERRPVGWREDDRTVKIMQVMGCSQKPQEIFESLSVVYAEAKKPRVKDGQMSVAALQGSWLFGKMMSAKGGDQLPVLKAGSNDS